MKEVIKLFVCMIFICKYWATSDCMEPSFNVEYSNLLILPKCKYCLLNFLVSDNKYSNSLVRRRREAYTVKNHHFMLTTSKTHRFKDHYRHQIEQTGNRRKRQSLHVNSWNRRKSFIRYARTHTYFYLTFDINWFIHEMKMKRCSLIVLIRQAKLFQNGSHWMEFGWFLVAMPRAHLSDNRGKWNSNKSFCIYRKYAVYSYLLHIELEKKTFPNSTTRFFTLRATNNK